MANTPNFIQPPNVTKTRIIRFDSQKNLWVVYVNVKEQYLFSTEDEALEFLKTAYLPPKISIVGRLLDKNRRGEPLEILRDFGKFLEARSLFTNEILLLRRSDIEVSSFRKKRLLFAQKDSFKPFKFNIGDVVVVRLHRKINLVDIFNKKGEIEDRWVDFLNGKPINIYRVKLDGIIVEVDENNLKKVSSLEKKAAIKYIDPTTNEVKNASDLGVTEDETAPEEVVKDNKKYKKIVVVE